MANQRVPVDFMPGHTLARYRDQVGKRDALGYLSCSDQERIAPSSHGIEVCLTQNINAMREQALAEIFKFNNRGK